MSTTISRKPNKLKKVTIGLYNIGANNDSKKQLIKIDRFSTETNPDTTNTLDDERLGHTDMNSAFCKKNYALCFGQNGYIQFKNKYIVNPTFEKTFLQFLSLVSYTGEELVPVPEIINAIKKYNSHTGMRKLNGIIKSMKSSSRKWQLVGLEEDEEYGLEYIQRKDSYFIEIFQMKEMLKNFSRDMNSGRFGITYEQIGINYEYSQPENIIVDSIPVMQHILRLPNFIRNIKNPYTKQYEEILKYSLDDDPVKARKFYMNLLYGTTNTEQESLSKQIFASDKKAFIRGHALSKVGGQIIRSVVTPRPKDFIRPDEIGIPRILAKEISEKILYTPENSSYISDLVREGHITHIYQGGKYISLRKSKDIKFEFNKTYVLRELQDGDVVVINRPPTLHRNSILAGYVKLHDDDVIYVHQSLTKGMGMDFDGDESTIFIPYTILAKRDAEELMLITNHMASLASSSLLVGYHQDVNLSAHMLSLSGCLLKPKVWNRLSKIVYKLLWSNKYPDYPEWIKYHHKKCIEAKIEPYSGKSLYSTLLPENFNWQMGDVQIVNGIHVKGILSSKNLSDSSSSIGMVLHATYGSKIAVEWLNASYNMLSEYLMLTGTTLGFSHLELQSDQKKEIQSLIKQYEEKKELLLDTESIEDEVLRDRKEAEITQELNNVREMVSVIVMKPKNPKYSLLIKGKATGIIILHEKPQISAPLSIPTSFPDDTIISNKTYTFNANEDININMYSGIIEYGNYKWNMYQFNRIECIVDNVTIDRTYTTPNHLIMMIESGARGNSTNAIQIAGIIGQLTFGDGRVPRMMDKTKIGNDIGIRSLPTVSPGSNTPMSRGFIATSYLKGMNLSEYFLANIASRENLASNVSLTPDTGYLSRKLTIFNQNLKVDQIEGQKVITNERGIIAMNDYIFDPSKLFKLKDLATFVDVRKELSTIGTFTTNIISFIKIPFFDKLEKYVTYDDNLRRIIREYKGFNIILNIDPKIEKEYIDYYNYLKDILPKELDIPVIVLSTHYINLTNHTVHIIPLQSTKSIINTILEQDAISGIDISTASINRSSLNIKKGNILSVENILTIIRSGINFESMPMIINVTNQIKELTKTYTLLETLILSGKIQSI